MDDVQARAAHLAAHVHHHPTRRAKMPWLPEHVFSPGRIGAMMLRYLYSRNLRSVSP